VDVDDDEIQWDETAVVDEVEEEVKMEVDDTNKSTQIILPSQEDLIEDLSPILKRRKREEGVLSEQITWMPDTDELFLRLQIGISFIKDYDFSKKQSSPQELAIRIFQCAQNYIEYRNQIQDLVNSIENSEAVKLHRHYKRAIRKIIDAWNTESGILSGKYIALKNKIPAFMMEEIEKNIEEPKTDVTKRIEFIYAYLTRDKNVAIHQLVDVFRKHTQELCMSDIQNFSDLRLEQTNVSDLETAQNKELDEAVLSDLVSSDLVSSDPLPVVLPERLHIIKLSFDTAKNSEPEYEYPRQVTTGIANTGNSCFINVNLQMLWRIKVSCIMNIIVNNLLTLVHGSGYCTNYTPSPPLLIDC